MSTDAQIQKAFDRLQTSLLADEKSRCCGCLQLKPRSTQWLLGVYKPNENSHLDPAVYAVCPQCSVDPWMLRKAGIYVETLSRERAERGAV
jgi:hypothetical protein